MCIKSPSSISRSLGTKSYSTAGYTYNSKYNNISYQYIGRVTQTAQWVFPQFQSIETYLRTMSHTIIECQVIKSWKLRIKDEDKNTCYSKPYFRFFCVILKVSITKCRIELTCTILPLLPLTLILWIVSVLALFGRGLRMNGWDLSWNVRPNWAVLMASRRAVTSAPIST